VKEKCSYLNVIPNYANAHLKEQIISNTELAVIIMLLHIIILYNHLDQAQLDAITQILKF